MSVLFKRRYRLDIQEENSDKVISVTDLRLEIEMTKSVLSLPNKLRAKLYNPNNVTLEALKKKYTQVSLQVAYGDEPLQTIFVGEIVNFLPTTAGIDYYCNFTAKDGHRDWNNARINKSYGPNATLNQVLSDLSKNMRAARGYTSNFDSIADNPLGQTISGPVKDILDQLAIEYDFEWSVQDGTLMIVKLKEAIRTNRVQLINSETGMIMEPTTVTPNRVQVKTLMNPRLKPFYLFQLTTETARLQVGDLFFKRTERLTPEGIYKVQEVVHRGDTHTNEWFSHIQGILYQNE